MSVPLRAEAQAPGASSRETWYGWQTLVTTSVSHTTALSLFFMGNLGLTLPIAGLVFAPPIVHFAHGHVGRGFASFGINLGGAAVGAGVGFGAGVVADSGKGDWILTGPLIGAVIGATATNIVDATVLAYDRVGSTTGTGLKLNPRSTISFLPTADIQPGRVSFGVVGTF